MLEFLLIVVIFIAIISLGLLILIWNQLNKTDFRLLKIIDDIIKLNNTHYELNRSEFPLVED